MNSATLSCRHFADIEVQYCSFIFCAVKPNEINHINQIKTTYKQWLTMKNEKNRKIKKEEMNMDKISSLD